MKSRSDRWDAAFRRIDAGETIEQAAVAEGVEMTTAFALSAHRHRVAYLRRIAEMDDAKLGGIQDQVD